MGYLVCANCGGYYKLQPGESPEEFAECQCGGELIYKENINSNTEDEDKLPSITSVASSTKGGTSDSKSKFTHLPKALLASFLAIVAILFKFGVIGLGISYFMRYSNWHSSAAYMFVFLLLVFGSIILRKYIFK